MYLHVICAVEQVEHMIGNVARRHTAIFVDGEFPPGGVTYLLTPCVSLGGTKVAAGTTHACLKRYCGGEGRTCEG